MNWSEWTERISTPDLLFFFGVLLAVYTMMRMARKRAMRREESTRPSIDRAAMLAALRPPVDEEEPPSVPVPVSRLPSAETLELLQRLDNRIRTLEELLRAADRKIVELNGMLHQSPSLKPTAPQTTPAHHQAEGLSRARDLTSHARVSENSAPGKSLARSQAVYRLLDQGETASAIARKLGYPIGEVELIASLRG